MQLNIENILITITHLQLNQILTLNKPYSIEQINKTKPYT